MKEQKNILEDLNLFPVITEGEDDDIIDLDIVLSTGVGSDRTSLEESEEDRIAREAREKGKREQGGEEDEDGNNTVSTLELLQSYNTDGISTLSEEDQEIRKELLSHFKGEGFDEEGNIVDKDGNIVAKTEDVEKFVNDEPTYDDDGNQVDDKGNIVKTKSEVEFEKSAIKGVINELGYDLTDKDGNDITYDDTVEGWSQLAKDLGKIEGAKIQQQFLNSHPVLMDVAKHLIAGNDISTFNNTVDYSSIDKDKLSEDDKIQYIKQSFLVSGLDEDRANDMLTYIKDGKTIDKEFDRALTTLNKSQEEAKEERDRQYKDKLQKDQDSVIQYWTGVKSEIDKGVLGDISISKEDQESFYKYLSSPVDSDGNSQETLDMQKLSLADELKSRFLMFKKFDLTALVKKEVNKDKVTTLRERINKRSTKSKSNVSVNKNNSNKGNADISLDTLLE